MTSDFRQVFLPYCLQLQADGRYAVLNRRYKPVGMTAQAGAFVTYSEHPCLVQFKGLTTARVAKLSFKGSPDPQRIYLYDDTCVPTASAQHWAAYGQRLELLAKLLVIEE